MAQAPVKDLRGVPRPITKWSPLRTCGRSKNASASSAAASVQDIRDRKVGGGLDSPARKRAVSL